MPANVAVSPTAGGAAVAEATVRGIAASAGASRAERWWPPDPARLVRVVAGTLIVGVTSYLAANDEPGRVEANLFRLVNELPDAARAPLTGIMQLGALGAVAVLGVLAVFSRRVRLARDLVLAGGLAWGAAKLVQVAVHEQPPDLILPRVLLRGAPTPGLAFPASHVAVAAAMAAVAGAYLTRPQRRLAWMVVAAIGVARIYIGAHFPIDVAGGAALGWAVGSLVRLATPRAGPLADRLSAALCPAGIEARAVRLLRQHRGGSSFSVTDEAGTRWHVAVVGPDQPEADWLYRAWRLLAFRDVAEPVIPVPLHQVERAAYHYLLAGLAGHGPAAPVHTGTLEDGQAWVARPWTDGHSLAERAEILGERELALAWDELASLHAVGLSHGALTPDHVIVTARGGVRLVGLGSGATPASPDQRSRDIAELAIALAASADVATTVATGICRLGAVALADAVPHLQPLAITRASRVVASGRPGFIDTLRQTAASATGTTAGNPVRPGRVAARNLVPLAALGLAVFVLLPQAAHAGATFNALGRANWAWIGLAGGATAVTYLAGATVWIAAAPVPLALGRTYVVQLAAAAANRITPAGLGGMATNIGYLQRAGATKAQAITATAVNSGAGFIAHVVGLSLATVLGVGAGWHVPSADFDPLWPILIAVTGVFGAVGAGWWASRLRHRLAPVAAEVVATVRRLASHPVRTAALFAASGAVTASYAAAFVASVHAYSGSVPLTKLVVVYLGASAVAAAAPTPGGLGALDAALVAGTAATAFGEGESMERWHRSWPG